jgi:hypothetical protein
MHTAVIIEPRAHPALPFVLQNACTLPPTWSILVIHGRGNLAAVQAAIDATGAPQRFLAPIGLGVDNLTRVQYNALLTSAAFYRGLPTEMILIFQTDTLFVEPALLDAFMDFDYVGAPWKNGKVGNGGLSLRRRSKMIEICERIRPHECLQDLLSLPILEECTDIKNALAAMTPEQQTEEMNEDIFFSFQRAVPIRIPTWEQARTFSVEEISPWLTAPPFEGLTGPGPLPPVPYFFGLHAPWKHLTVEDTHRIVLNYPGLMELMRRQIDTQR